jgi:hypothetical protein
VAICGINGTNFVQFLNRLSIKLRWGQHFLLITEAINGYSYTKLKIYNIENPKIQNNVLEEIKVGSKKINSYADYDKIVFTNEYTGSTVVSTSQSPLIDTVVDRAYVGTSGSLTIYNISIAHISGQQTFANITVKFPVVRDDYYVSSIKTGEDAYGEPNIKVSMRGTIEKGIWKGKATAVGYDAEGNISASVSTTETELESVVQNTHYSFNMQQKIISWEQKGTAAAAPTDATAKVELDLGNLLEVNPEYETVDGIDYINLNIKALANWMMHKGGVTTQYTHNSFPFTISGLKGNYEKYTYDTISITIYGNTVGINLADYTLAVGNEETQNPFSLVEENELMQETNYKLSSLTEETDYWIGESSYTDDGSSTTHYYTSVHLYNTYSTETWVTYTTPSGTSYQVLIPAKATTHSPAIDCTEGYVTINSVYNHKPAIIVDFSKTLSSYENGKETATVRCSIGDYYDTENGLTITPKTDSKMTFEIGDKVVPMVRNSEGGDNALSYHSNGTAKVFNVVGEKYTYDGAVWQELTLRETAEGIYYVDSPPYLTFSSSEEFTLETNAHLHYWNGIIEYSTDLTNWAVWNGETIISSYRGKLYLRGSGNTTITNGGSNGAFKLTGANIDCKGNIETLLDYQTVKRGEHPKMGAKCFYCLFIRNDALIGVPSLPSTTLSSWCYEMMFRECINLTELPNLPAKNLPYCCYSNMFLDCSSIKISTTKSNEYNREYRIPIVGDATVDESSLNVMFTGTGGEFKGTPEVNTTYYTSNKLV